MTASSDSSGAPLRLTGAPLRPKIGKMRAGRYAKPATFGVLSLLGWLSAGCPEQGTTPTTRPEQASPAQAAPAPDTMVGVEAAPSGAAAVERLEAHLGELALKARGTVGVSIVHVESGRRATVNAQQLLPLQSVFKLPLAVGVLRRVQTGEMSLERALTVRAEDRAPGVVANEKKWAQLPRDVSIRQLLEDSLVDSDNTSSDKLLDSIGGPAALTRQMQSLGLDGIFVRAPTQAMGPSGELPNEATAEALAQLLVSLSRGELLEASQRRLLWDLMGRARTGERRIRAGLPPGTQVLEKTGTGAKGRVTNDVGLVTLPGDAGHLAIAVLIAGSELPTRAQEDVIAEIARAAFDTFARSP